MTGGERPEDCPSRIGLAAGGGFVAGSLFGAVASNWGDIPVVIRDKPWPALVRTGSVMASYGSTLALVGAAFATVDVSLSWAGRRLLLPLRTWPLPTAWEVAANTPCQIAFLHCHSAWPRRCVARRTG